MRRAIATALLLLFALAGAACGKRGPPRAPEPRGPYPPGEVAARQVGDAAEVGFVVPKPRGAKPSQTLAGAELVRVAYGPGLHPTADPDAFRRSGTVVASSGGSSLAPGSRFALVDPTVTRLASGGVGWTLRYGVRVRDQRGRPSALVVAPDLVAVAPPLPPRGLRGEATSDGIRLAWTPPSPEGVLKYNVYRTVPDRPFGETPINPEPIASTDYLDGGVTIGVTYLYAVRTAAADTPPYRESASSETLRVLAEDRFAPAPPTGLVAVQEGSAVRLFWNPSRESDLAGYRVYRRIGGLEWSRIGPERIAEPFFLDPAVTAGERLAYRVTAVDRAGNESGPSVVAELRATADVGPPGGAGP